MTPELQHALVSLVYLVGTGMIAVPATLRAIPPAIDRVLKMLERVSQARADEASSVRTAIEELRARLDATVEDHDRCQRDRDELRAQIQHASARADADAEVIERFARRIEELERVTNSQRSEIADLRRVISTGRNA